MNGATPTAMELKTADKRLDTDAIKEWLIGFRERENDIRNQINRLDVIETRLTSIGSPVLSDMPKSPSPVQDRMAYMVGVKVDLEQEIKEQQEEQKRIRRVIELLLRGIRKSEERTVIRARYLDCGFYHADRLSDWNDVSNTLFGDREDFLDKEDSYLRRVHKIHGAALVNLARYIEEHPIPDIPADV